VRVWGGGRQPCVCASLLISAWHGTADLGALRRRFASQWAELEEDVQRLDLSAAHERDAMARRIQALEQENARLRQRLSEAELTLAMHGLALRYAPSLPPCVFLRD
jgi:outer membrane murein-binding lipoprotein Lpp